MAYTTIKKPSDYFNTKLYTGTGAEHNITGVGFQPDWTWIKERSSATSHRVFDIIRGATVEMFTDLTDGESSDAQSLKSFDSDGFTLGTDGATNGSSDTYVAWNWLASNTTASNTDGSITSTVSANTTSGFSIVSYTGTGANATVGHGLGVAPNVIITKKRNGTVQWNFQNSMRGYNEYMALNSTEPSQATGGAIISSVSSTTYSCDGNDVVNANSGTYVSYCFAEKQGFSKFGSYVGNGNADGTFVYTGFKPAFVIVKRSDVANNWLLCDNKRNSFNVVSNAVFPDVSDAEATSTDRFDFLSNGFKIRTTSGLSNTSGGTYIYMAFAEEPLVGDNPATAR